MSTSLDSLPIIDLSLLAGDGADVAAFDEALLRATHEVGFFYLVGHGIPEDLVEHLFAEAERFFALPEADKLDVEIEVPHLNMPAKLFR